MKQCHSNELNFILIYIIIEAKNKQYQFVH